MKDLGILNQRHEEREPNPRAKYERYRPANQTLAEKIAWGIKVSKLIEEDRIMQGLSIIGTKQVGDIVVQLGRTPDEGVWHVWEEHDGNRRNQIKTDRESDAWGQWGLRIKALQD